MKPRLRPPWVYAIPGADHATLAVADFTGDGDLDAVTVQDFYDYGTGSPLPGNCNGTFVQAIYMGGATGAVAAGHFSVDEYIDLVSSASDENGYGFLQTYLSDGAGRLHLPDGPFNVQCRRRVGGRVH